MVNNDSMFMRSYATNNLSDPFRRFFTNCLRDRQRKLAAGLIQEDTVLSFFWNKEARELSTGQIKKLEQEHIHIYFVNSEYGWFRYALDENNNIIHIPKLGGESIGRKEK